MKRVFDILLPRFITEDVALVLDHELGCLVPVCAVSDLEHHERPHAVCQMRSFNLFGFALLPKMVGDPEDWPRYCARKTKSKT